MLMNKADRVLDTFGLLCPIPIIKTAKEMKTMAVGEVLEVLSDDRGITADMPAWCRATGNELLAIEERGREYHLFVRKARE